MTSTRFMAAIVGLSVVLPLVAWGGMAGTTFVVLCAMAVCLGEYATMAFPEDIRYAFYWLCLNSVTLAVTLVWGPHENLAAVAGVLLAITMAQVTLSPPEPITFAADRLGRYVLGTVWIGGLFPTLLLMRRWEHGLAFVVLVMVISWFGDTGAYFAGRAFGRTPLHPKVSPKKTWEGFAGGVVASGVGASLMQLFFLPDLGVVEAPILGVLASAMSVLGDLSESMIKRSFDVKDSGWIMPGHGGLLDRVDSVLFVAPTVYAWMVLGRGF